MSAARVLVVYSGVYGHTLRICEAIQRMLEARGAAVKLAALPEETPDPSDFDAILIGAAIRNGKHNPAVLDFIERHRTLLEEKVNAFFSVNLVARKPNKNTPETNPYVRAFLRTSPWQPQQVAVFGGRLAYRRYRPLDRWVIRLIMWINRGPTDLDTEVEFTDWDAVGRFAEHLAARVQSSPS